MLHRTSKLTPFGRRLLVDRILPEGWPAATAALGMGVLARLVRRQLRGELEKFARIAERDRGPET